MLFPPNSYCNDAKKNNNNYLYETRKILLQLCKKGEKISTCKIQKTEKGKWILHKEK